jgi:hypothetical protein
MLAQESSDETEKRKGEAEETCKDRWRTGEFGIFVRARYDTLQ